MTWYCILCAVWRLFCSTDFYHIFFLFSLNEVFSVSFVCYWVVVLPFVISINRLSFFTKHVFLRAILSMLYLSNGPYFDGFYPCMFCCKTRSFSLMRLRKMTREVSIEKKNTFTQRFPLKQQIIPQSLPNSFISLILLKEISTKSHNIDETVIYPNNFIHIP